MSTIRADYDNARSQARQLENAAVRCEEIVRNLRISVEETPSYWEGASANAFREAMNEQITAVRQIGERARKLGVQIRRVADELEETERLLAAEIEAQKASQASNGLRSGS